MGQNFRFEIGEFRRGRLSETFLGGAPGEEDDWDIGEGDGGEGEDRAEDEFVHIEGAGGGIGVVLATPDVYLREAEID